MTDTSNRLPGAHGHIFLGQDHVRNERRTWIVVGITTVTMVVEIAAGTLFGSIALVADGWHMFTHASALAIAALAYRFARRHADDPRFTFGTGKMGDLAAFASAIGLGLIALLIAWESLMRLANPVSIDFGQATAVAVAGLLVNLVCALILGGHGHDHAPSAHSHDHAHDHHHHHHDHHDHHHHEHPHPHADVPATDNNLHAAYLHVLADALTSVLAIVALVAGGLFGAQWLDPVIGIVGAVVIARWSLGLMRDAGRVLVDFVPEIGAVSAEIRQTLETEGDRITDLHVWKLGPGHLGAIVSVVSNAPQSCDSYRARLAGLPTLSHVTVEVHRRV
jgi:cation diffusion facilitator family transporter